MATPFAVDEAGYKCFRIPSLVKAEDGNLLAFAEGRVANCSDVGDIDIVMKRSIDHGRNWGPIQVIRGADDDHGSQTSRRTVLAGIVAAAAGAPLLNTFTATPAVAAGVEYASNTDLYANTEEGVDFARRFKRHEMVDIQRPPAPLPA